MFSLSSVESFAGLPVMEFPPRGPRPEVADPSAVAWRLNLDYDDQPDDFSAYLERFLSAVDGAAVRALVIAQWGGAAYEHAAPVGLLAAAAPRLPNLRALFLGAMTPEECEISWITQTDITPLFTAYPLLEELRVRGAQGLETSPVRHEHLRSFVIESGGLPGGVVRAIGAADLPAVDHLELWLGTSDYGGDATIEDLGEILRGARLPALRYLGLRDAEIADEVAAALAAAPVVARLEVLDLSLGVLSDRGALALLAGQPLTHLRTLDLSHHYLSEDVMRRMVAELPGVEVNVDDQQSDDEDSRYVAVSE